MTTRNQRTVNILIVVGLIIGCAYGYLIYERLTEKKPKQVNMVCRITGAQKEKNIVSFTCLQD